MEEIVRKLEERVAKLEGCLQPQGGAGTVNENKKKLRRRRFAASAGGVVMFILGLVAAHYHNHTGSTEQFWRGASVILMTFWTIGPPAWFVWEYHFVMDNLRHDELEVLKLKDGQALANKFWLAVGVVLVAAFANWIPDRVSFRARSAHSWEARML